MPEPFSIFNEFSQNNNIIYAISDYTITTY